MATSTRSKVTRVTETEYRSAILGQKPRKVVVTIGPGDTLVLRQQRCKQQEHISIKDVIEYARWSRLKAERLQKRRGAR